MGRQVVYCDKCGRMLREDDFERGQAHTVENRSFCIQCRPLASLPPPAPPPATPKPFKHVSSTRIPRPPSGEMKVPPAEVPQPPLASPPASRGPLVTGVVITVIAVVGAAFALMSGGKGGRGGDKEELRTYSSDPKPYKGPDRGPGPDVTPPVPAAEDSARKAFAKAADFRRMNPTDVVGQFKAFDEIVQLYGTSGVADSARRELTSIRRRFTDELGQVSEQARIPLGNEEFQAVIDLWKRAKSRYAHAEWTGPAEDKIRETGEMAASRFGTLLAKAAEAKKIGDGNGVKKQRERLGRWGLANYVGDFDKVLADVTPDVPDKPEKTPPPPSKEAEIYLGAWREAVALATRRDYDAAQALLQKASEALKEKEAKGDAARDLEDLALAGRAGTEGRALISRIAKGQKVALSYTDDGWARASVEGMVASTDGQRMEIKKGEESVLVLAGEIGAATAAELFRGRAAKLPTDARAAALLCMIEGDAEAAKKIAVDPPLAAKYAGVAGEVAEALKAVAPKEAEARKAFIEAEGSYFDPLRTADAVKLYRSLLAEFGATGFVRRNKGAISARSEGGKEFFLLFSDMGSAGFFKQGKHNGVEAWMSTKDQEMAQLKDNYVQVDFSALAETDYRLWVYAGGCCQEVFTFFVQGTDLTAPNPKKPAEMIAVPLGGDVAGSVKMPYLSVKKKHSDHSGPKEPDKWEWVQVPLPKYAAAGLKSVRLLTVQKGFSVAGAVVSALRTLPPKDKDLADAERAKAETPGYLLYRAGAATGGIFREWWLNIQGGDVSNLTSNPGFPDKPSGSKVEETFAAPTDWADNYGTRMRGWVHPPVTGNYTFWIACDDRGELWLSSDDTPEKKQKIATVPDYTAPHEWGKNPAQKSAPIALVAGRRYYVEALHKEGVGGDNVSAGWQLPDGKMERPIPGNRLSPWKKK